MSTPVVYQYQQALDEFRREGREPPLLKRMSELISLLDLTTALGSAASAGEILDAALLIVMGELQVARGALYVAEADGPFRLRAARGLPPDAPQAFAWEAAAGPAFEPRLVDASLANAGLALVCPVRRAARTIALLALGPRAGDQPFGREELGFLESLAACAATPIENGLIYEELRSVNRTLSVKVFQLHNLFDIGRELVSTLDVPAIERLVATSVMGHFLASRSAVFRARDDGRLELVHARGVRLEEMAQVLPAEAHGLVREMGTARRVESLPAGELRDALLRERFALAVPLAAADRVSGLLVVGERPAGRAYGEDEIDFAGALARQAQAALEAADLHRVRVTKERQDRELQIAREIQQSLFPRGLPRVAGFEIAAVSRSCYEVGGDYYDFIPLERERLALVVADVSGKGTPASILMASVHASLQALAGSAHPRELLERLNRFLYDNTQASRYVTLFYGELDPARRTLTYVNAGHVPPYLLRADGRRERLVAGGPVIGLLEQVCEEAAEVTLAAGDLLAVVTDGVTEAQDVEGEEFGDGRALAALVPAAGRGAEAALDALVAAVGSWTGPVGCTDDLTVLTLRAT